MRGAARGTAHGVRGTAHGAQRRQEPRHPSAGALSMGADDGTRTRDPHLGKVMLYQLSHVRVKGSEEPSWAILGSNQ